MNHVDDPSGQWARLPELAPILVASPFAAFVLALLRGVYEDKEKRKIRIVLEAAICSGISVFVMTAIVIAALYLQIPIPIPKEYQLYFLFIVASGIGSFVGFIGADEIRRIIRKLIRSHV